jgi:hypothetical protein
MIIMYHLELTPKSFELFILESESIPNEFFIVYKACEDYLMEWIKPS